MLHLHPSRTELTLEAMLAELADGIEASVADVRQVDESALWTPLPGPQTLAYFCEADELFYGGAGGGGKTDLGLGLAITAHQSSIIFRREFSQFRGPEGIIERSRQIIGMRGKLNENLFVWRNLPGGRSIEFGAVQYEETKNKYKGRPHDLKVFDELPEFTESQYRFLIAWLRTSIVEQRTRVVNTGNPPTTPEGQWVIAYWGPWLDKQHPNPAKPGELRWFATINGKDVELPNSDPVKNEHGEWIRPRSRTFIPARVEDNPYYMRTGYADVLANLPEPLRSQMRHGNFQVGQADNPWQGIPTAWVKAAQARWTPRPDPGPLTAVGNDPSRGGDDQFVIAKRYGAWLAPLEKHPGITVPDGPTGARLLWKSVNGDKTVPLNIDIGGSAGSSVYDQARGLKLKVFALNGSEKSVARDKSGRLGFVNKRAEWHWRMREYLDPTSKQEIALPPDPQLFSDLCAWRWFITPRGIQVEDKDDIKARIGRSPDSGEAVMYATAADPLGLGWLEQMKKDAAAAAAPGEDPNVILDAPEVTPPTGDHYQCRLTGKTKVRGERRADGKIQQRCLNCNTIVAVLE
jgi:hypothetical protein